MNAVQPLEEILDGIRRHYWHAIKKHPLFCYGLLPVDVPNNQMSESEMLDAISRNLSASRRRIKAGYDNRNLLWNELLNCEVWEITEAIAKRNTGDAIEECLDAIAILVRVALALKGIQKLGEPEEVAK